MDPKVWGPETGRFEYDSYLKTLARPPPTKYGPGAGLGASDGGPGRAEKLDRDPWLQSGIFAGLRVSPIDYREPPAGHAYALFGPGSRRSAWTDKQQPGRRCIQCHALEPSPLPLRRGTAGRSEGPSRRSRECRIAHVHDMKDDKGPAPRPASDRRASSCHDPKTMAIRVTPPRLPGPASRRSRPSRVSPITIRTATPPARRCASFVCGQCHVEYYFQGPGQRVGDLPVGETGSRSRRIEAYIRSGRLHGLRPHRDPAPQGPEGPASGVSKVVVARGVATLRRGRGRGRGADLPHALRARGRAEGGSDHWVAQPAC